MKTLLLFGSTGFVGKNIADYFSKYHSIHLIMPKREECDVLHYREVKRCIDTIKPDIIINAAYIEVNSNIKPTKKYLRLNLKIPMNILKASRDKKQIERVIFFGSGLEYGDAKRPISENHSLNPKNYYAYTKSVCSTESVRFAQKNNVPLVIIKAFNLYGINDKKSVLHYVIEHILTKKTFSVTKGEQIRDFLYITDLILLIERIIKTKKKLENGEIINAGTGNGVLLQDAINQICRMIGYEGDFLIRDYREGEYFKQVADISKAKKLFAWKSKTSFKKGLQKTVAWEKEC